jgi:hypothetical protein
MKLSAILAPGQQRVTRARPSGPTRIDHRSSRSMSRLSMQEARQA